MYKVVAVVTGGLLKKTRAGVFKGEDTMHDINHVGPLLTFTSGSKCILVYIQMYTRRPLALAIKTNEPVCNS